MIGQLKKNGFVVFRDLLPVGTVDDLRAFLESEPPPADDSGYYRLNTRLSPKLWTVADAPALRDLLAAWFGTDKLRMHMPPQIRCVTPDNPQVAVPAHQDASYNGHISGDFLTVWVPLVAIDSDCGGVGFYKGTANAPVIPTAPSGRPYLLHAIPTDGLSMVTHDMKPGDALIFNQQVIHASMPNRSNRTRYSIDYRFFAGSSAKHYLDLQTSTVVAPR